MSKADPHFDQRLEKIKKQANDLRNRLHRLGTTGPFSACEMRLDDDLYGQLCQWGQRPLWKCANLASWETGLVLLAIASEIVRRDGDEGGYWQCLETCLHERILKWLRKDRDREWKRLLRAAVEKTGLRNRLTGSSPDEKLVMNTIFLQFGFTRSGIEQLPQWLTKRNVPNAVRLLLEDDQLYSASFAQLWNSLKYYRRNEITVHRLREVLESSPWVLPEWHDDLVRKAKEQPELRDADEELGESADSVTDFVGEPRLRWDGSGDPYFECDLNRLAGDQLLASHYDLQVPDERGRTQTCRLLPRPDGSYVAKCNTIRLPYHLPEVILRLIAPQKREASGATMESDALPPQVLQLWDATAPVNVFDAKTGKRLEDADTPDLSTDKNYFLLVADGMHVDPSPEHWYLLDGPPPGTLCLLARPWSDQLCVRDSAGREVWKPVLQRSSIESPAPAWTEEFLQQVRVKPSEFSLGDTLTLKVPRHSSIKLVAAQLNREPLEVGHFDLVWQGTATPEMVLGGLKLRCRLENGGQFDKTECDLIQRWRLSLKGICRYGRNGWESLPPKTRLTVRELQRDVFRIFLPRRLEDQSQVALMEGPRLCRWITRRPRSLDPGGRLLGLGSPLYVKEGPFELERPILFPVANAVFDHGEVADVRYDPVTNDHKICLNRPIQPGEQHVVIWWSPGHTPQFFAGPEVGCDENSRCWHVPCPIPERGDCSAIGLAYDGQWLGVGWCGAPEDIFNAADDITKESDADVLGMFAIMRWLRLPVLLETDEQNVSVFTGFARRYPAQMLAAWWLEHGLPDGLQYDGDARRRSEVVLGQLFFNWAPEGNEREATLDSMIDALVGPQNTDSRVAALTDFLKKGFLYAFPQLSGQLLFYLLSCQNPASDARHLAAWNGAMYQSLWERECDAAMSDNSQNWLAFEASRALRFEANETYYQLSETFVENLADIALWGDKSPYLRAKSNLLVALQNVRFCQYLAHKVLDDVASRLRSFIS